MARGSVDMDTARLWAPFIVVASLLGGLMAGLYSGGVLKLVFGVVALFVALNMVVPVKKPVLEGIAHLRWVNRVAALVIGYTSALMGIGGGSLTVPTLVAFGKSMHTAVGTSSALGVILAVPAVIGFVISGWNVPGTPPLSLGYVNIPSFVLIGVLATVTVPWGVAIAHKLNARMLKAVFALFLLFVGSRMILQAVVG